MGIIGVRVGDHWSEGRGSLHGGVRMGDHWSEGGRSLE